MDGQLKNGTILTSESGNKYTVNRLLGAGGQGEVYSVDSNGRAYALKWYYKNTATKNQKEILDNLIQKGQPDTSFLWPQDMVFKSYGESFGYIMPLRPKNYKSIVDMMKRKAEPSFYCLCRAAFNLTKGYNALHGKGYSYRDISFGNVFFDPDTGDVLICDNDNVSYNGAESGVYGTPRFMAPEIVTGKAKPSRNTDLFSLAVLLFYMFMLNHPLEGKREAHIKCMDIHAMNQLYGTDPLFIFDPDNKDNRPLAGYQDNALVFWALYPKQLKDLFTTSFTVGLKQPNRRITEAKWLDTFANLMSEIMICPNCGAEVFYDFQKEENGVAHICWGCQRTVMVPSKIVIGRNAVLLLANTKIYKHHIEGNHDMDTVVGEVVQNPNNPNMWGVKNLSKENWTYIKADGTQIPVAEGRSAAIARDAKIDFGQNIGAMDKEKKILSTYMVLKDCLEDDDDFEKLHKLLEQMAKYDAKKAFDMWYPLLKKYEYFVTEKHVNETYNFVSCNLELLGEALGHKKFDKIILQDRYLYELLFKRYCYAAEHYDYTQELIVRIMMRDNNVLADNIFADVYNNGNRTESWFEIMDGFLQEVVYDDFIPSEESIALLSKWSSKVEDKKERAKIMSSMLATGLNFDVDLLQQEENIKTEVIASVDMSDLYLPLKNLTSKYPQAISDRQVLRGLLSDFYPDNRLYVNILMMAYDEGLVDEIHSADIVEYFMVQRMSSRLVNNYGINEKLAESVIEAWTGALK